jgi:hypothetical protein
MVDHRRSTSDQPITNTMDRLQVQLIIRLDRNKTHVLALDGLGDRLRIDEVVLVRLHKRLHELSCDQPHVMALLL